MDECQFQHVPANPQARRILHGVPSAFKDDSEFVLKNLYHTVGLTEELFRTACLFSIAIHQRVPPQCDCSNGVVGEEGGEGSDAERDGGENNNVDKLDNKTPLYDDTMEITEEQSQAILRITEHDQELYDTASRLFWEEVARVQNVHAFRLC